MVDMATGDETGIVFPAHPDALRAAGPDFLTRAFRAYGALDADNAVTAITRCEPFLGGNSGDKLLLDIACARPGEHVPDALFVKFSRCVADPFRDRRRGEMASEVRLAALSRHPAFPVAVPRPCFADFEAATGTGILITQRIAYGQNGIEPARRKNMDHELANPLEHYRATVTALARLAGAWQSGRLDPDAQRLFPYDRSAAMAELPVVLDEADIAARAVQIGTFIAASPQLFPPNVTGGDFSARLVIDAVRLRQNEAAVRAFLFNDPAFIALAHWNTHIDNAWFRRTDAGVLEAGLLDWGMVRPMNVATALWGGLSGAQTELWNRHLDELLTLFIAELGSAGGARIDRATLRLHLDMTVGLLCLALMWDTPALLTARMPGIGALSGLQDPELATDKVVQGFLHTFVAAMNLWERHDFGASLDAVLAQSGAAR